jgi:hypothetical protein
MSPRNASLTKCRSLIALVAFVAMVAGGLLISMPTSAAGKKTQLAKPTIACDGASPVRIGIKVCGGADGAPAGFTVQWITAAELAAGADGQVGTADDGIWWNGPSYCGASFSGVPGCATQYNLGPGACVTVQIGDVLFDECGASSECANVPLLCDTQYAFRAFAHNVPGGLNKSDFTATLFCSTASCGGGDTGGCTFTQGYWKTHGPIPTGNNSDVWPTCAVVVGSTTYNVDNNPLNTDALAVLAIFNSSGGNNLLALAHQVIAAQLNKCSGASSTAAVDQAIVDANNLIAIYGLNTAPSAADKILAGALTTTLTDYNEGTTGPGHCPN